VAPAANTSVPQLVEAGADDLRLAAQAVGVLHPVVAFAVGGADLAVDEQGAVVVRDVDLARLAAQFVDARVERPIAAARGVDRQRADDQRGLQHRLEAKQGVQRQGRRGLRAVDQRQPLLGRQLQRLDAGAAQQRRGGRAPAVDQHLAFAQQRERHVRQRRQVAGGADRSLARDVRHQPGVVHRDQGVDHLRSHA
jgi:hypothetical protein